jgi:hypothetical protein
VGSEKTAGDSSHRGWRARVTSPTIAAVNYYSGLSEPARVALGVVGILLAIIVPILLIVYRAEIWTGIVLTIKVLALGAVLAAALGAVVWALRKRRRAVEGAQTARVAALQAREQERAALLKAIEEGRCARPLDPGRLLLRNSETLWFRCPASLSDDKGTLFAGELYITSMRTVFICAQYPVEIPVDNINAVDRGPEEVQVICRSARRTEVFRVGDAEVTAAHIARSVRAYQRQIDVGFESDASRHIPQDVKTAVWQRDGGKCVQCGAADYLEFDHIIPHAKGGASTVQNVQLLCRRCNLKKGAAI